MRRILFSLVPLVFMTSFGCGQSDPPAPESLLVRSGALSSPALVETVDITLPSVPVGQVPNLALAARAGVTLEDRDSISGSADSGGNISVGNDARVGSILASGTIAIGARTQAAALRAGGKITLGSGSSSTSDQPTSVPPASSLIHFTVSVPAASQDVVVNPGGSAAPKPGSYGQLSVFSRAQLTLAPGTYYFRSIDIEPQASVILSSSGPVILYVTGSLNFAGAISDGGDPTRLQLFYFGSTAFRFNAPFRGTFVAPSASVQAGSGAFTGFIYANTLDLGPDFSFTPLQLTATPLTATPLALIAHSPIGPLLVVTNPVPFAATQGVPFSGTVATVTDSDTGDTVTTFQNPDGSFTNNVTIQWGDGSSSTGTLSGGAGSFTVTGQHTYDLTGPMTVVVTITNPSTGATATTTENVVVAKQLSITSADINVTQGVPFNLPLATLSDANTTDTVAPFNVQINWGDKTAATTGTITGGGGTFVVAGQHTYDLTGMVSVTVTVTDASSQAQVVTTLFAQIAPQLDCSGQRRSELPAGGTEDFQLVFTDANLTDQFSDFQTPSINWGDGTSSSSIVTTVLPDDPGFFEVPAGGHVYGTPGTYDLTAAVTNKSGATCTIDVTVFVGVSDTMAVTFSATAGQAFDGVVGTFFDPSPFVTGTIPAPFEGAGNITPAIDWGDGTPVSTGSYSVISSPNLGANVVGTHTYALSGQYVVTVTVETAFGFESVTSTALVGM
jgi:hypothetical protein